MKTTSTRHKDTPAHQLSDREATLRTVAKQAFLQSFAPNKATTPTVDVRMENGLMTLTGRLVSPDGKTIAQADIIGDPRQAADLGKLLADHMLHF